jgi:proteic killer suppression protein
VIVSFRNRGTEDIFRGVDSPRARRACPAQIWPVTQRKLRDLDRAESLDDLWRTPGNRLHPLYGSRAGQHAIRVNDQFRICFRWTVGGAEDVEIVDYH